MDRSHLTAAVEGLTSQRSVAFARQSTNQATTVSALDPTDPVAMAYQAFEQEFSNLRMQASVPGIQMAQASFESFRAGQEGAKEVMASEIKLANTLEALAGKIQIPGMDYIATSEGRVQASPIKRTYKPSKAQLLCAANIAKWTTESKNMRRSVALSGERVEAQATLESQSIAAGRPTIRASQIGHDVNSVTPMSRLGMLNTGGHRAPSLNTSLEAFEEARHGQPMALATLAFNFFAPQQIAALDMVFRPVPVPHEAGGYNVVISLVYLIREVTHATSGQQLALQRRLLSDAYVDPSILDSGQTRVVPIYDANNASTVGFFDTRAAFTLQAGPNTVSTAPLKLGQDVESIIGLSAREDLIRRGELNQTDIIEASQYLESVFVEITGTVAGNSVTELFKIDATSVGAGYAAFPAPTGNTQDVVIDWAAAKVPFKATTKQHNGDASVLLPALLGPMEALVNIKCHLRQTCDTGYLSLGGKTKLKLVALYDASKENVTAAAGNAAIRTAFNGAETASVVLYQTFTNRNRRQIGQLGDEQQIVLAVSVPYRSPVAVLRPDDDNAASLDPARVKTLLGMVGANITADGLKVLGNAARVLKASMTSNLPLHERVTYAGAQSYYTRPYVIDEPVDVREMTDSPTSGARAEDVKTSLINWLRDRAITLYTESGLRNFMHNYYSGQPPKLLLKVVCDPRTKSYLMLTGDLRSLGDVFDIRIEEVMHKDWAGGRLTAVLGMPDGTDSGMINILDSGNFLIRPEVLTNAAAWRDGSTRRELVAVPSYVHILHTNAIIDVQVQGLSDVMTTKNTINFHTV